MTDPIRSALKRLLSAVLDGLGQDDHPMGWARVDDAIDAARAALAAEPVAEWPTGDAAVEAAAELIYNQAMKWAATQPIPSDHINIPAWQQGGNSDAQEVARRTARAALAAKPLVKGPTDEELLELWQGWNLGWDPQKGMVLMPHPAEYARAVLARYSRQPAPPAEGEVAELVSLLRSEAVHDEINDHMAWLAPADARRAAELLEQRHSAPVPVSERLPGPGDCDGEGRCYAWDWLASDWRMVPAEWVQTKLDYNWWLPADALPLPQGEVE